MNQHGIVRAPGNAVARQGLGTQELEQRAETSIAAATEEARAIVNAKCILAIERPRAWDMVRGRILADCKRPRFAEEAKYLKPIGDGIEGPSVRFAEACARHMGNLWRTARVTYEDTFSRHVLLSIMDLETNLTLDEEIVIEKSVERRKADDRTVLGQRKNSYGQTVYVVQATDDEILNKANALKKKAERNLILAFVPADIVEEAMEAVDATKEQEARQADQREQQRKRMVTEFAKLHVTQADLEAWLGHPVAEVTPREMAELGSVYNAMKDGEGKWADHLESRRSRRPQTAAPAPTPAAQTPPPATPPPAPAAATATPAPQSEAGPLAQDAPTTSSPAYASGGPAEGISEEDKARARLLERIDAAENVPALNKLAQAVRDSNDAQVVKAYGQRKAALTSNGGAR